ncbi:hypothetical protein FOA52_011018 [Chlamydomonas sp. UWO 241]|nr:hypothetical protein FOA52_011018 [Chlamydomonas sp. UWO 241]
MIKGALDYLLGTSLDAKLLRDSFVFKVIPMLNPDGVIVGNYRCSLAGQDLNRVWHAPSRSLHPTIYATKQLNKEFMQEREVTMFCDLHGHSRKKGIFMYGCEKQARDFSPMFPNFPVPGSHGGLPSAPVRLQEKVFPLLLQANLPDLFNYNSCNFKVQKSKHGTGRVVGFRELGLVNALTMEASFCGAGNGSKWSGQHFSTWHLEQMGCALCTCLLDYWDPEAYGHADLFAQLEYMHPEGEASRKLVLTTDGTYIDAADADEDDEVPTDSSDEDSDEESKKARAEDKKRRVARKAAGAAAAAAGAPLGYGPPQFVCVAGAGSQGPGGAGGAQQFVCVAGAGGQGTGGAGGAQQAQGPLPPQAQAHQQVAAHQAYVAAYVAMSGGDPPPGPDEGMGDPVAHAAASEAAAQAAAQVAYQYQIAAARQQGAPSSSGAPPPAYLAMAAAGGYGSPPGGYNKPSVSGQGALSQMWPQYGVPGGTGVAGGTAYSAMSPAVHAVMTQQQQVMVRSVSGPATSSRPGTASASGSNGLPHAASDGGGATGTAAAAAAANGDGGGGAAGGGVYRGGGGGAVAGGEKVKKKKGRKKLDRALLQAEALKASEGLAECLPLVCAHQDERIAAAAAADAADAAARERAYCGGISYHGPGALGGAAAGLGADLIAGRGGARAPLRPGSSHRDLAQGLEYARQLRGGGRGEDDSWAYSGMSILPAPPAPPGHLGALPAALPSQLATLTPHNFRGAAQQPGGAPHDAPECARGATARPGAPVALSRVASQSQLLLQQMQQQQQFQQQQQQQQPALQIPDALGRMRSSGLVGQQQQQQQQQQTAPPSPPTADALGRFTGCGGVGEEGGSRALGRSLTPPTHRGLVGIHSPTQQTLQISTMTDNPLLFDAAR